MDRIDELLEIVGAGNYSGDPAVLKKHASDYPSRHELLLLLLPHYFKVTS